MRPNIGAIDSFIRMPYLCQDIPALKDEFPQYIAAAEDIRQHSSLQDYIEAL